MSRWRVALRAALALGAAYVVLAFAVPAFVPPPPAIGLAAELVRSGVEVRRCATLGERCHARQPYVGAARRHALPLGSGNFTRRNLHDLNLETDVRAEAAADEPLARTVREHFDRLWNNMPDRTYSSDYKTHADESPWLTLQYRLMEASGLSTF